eukprot:jgi/Ulvmu1/6874/UM031_0079.1
MFTTGLFINARGQQIATTQCLPTDNKVKAVIHYHHGLGDYAMRNRELFEFLASKNIATATFDVHGHGHSEPKDPRFAIRSFSDVVADALQHVERILIPFCKSKCPEAPVFLMGSSMGALASVLMAMKPPAKDFTSIKGVILNAAAMDATRTLVMRIQEPLAGLANILVPNMALVPRLSPDKFCRDPEQAKVREADTLLNAKALKVCTACSMLEGFKMVQDCGPDFTLPVLAVHGDQDDVCPITHVEAFLSRIGSIDKELKRFPDGLHDMLHDYERDEVWDAILSWVDIRL